MFLLKLKPRMEASANLEEELKEKSGWRRLKTGARMFGSTLATTVLIVIGLVLIVQIVLASTQHSDKTLTIWLHLCSEDAWHTYYQYRFFDTLAAAASEFCFEHSEECGSDAFERENCVITEDRVDIINVPRIRERLLVFSFIIAMPRCAWNNLTTNDTLHFRSRFLPNKILAAEFEDIIESDRANIEQGIECKIAGIEKVRLTVEDYLVRYTLPGAFGFMFTLPIIRMLLVIREKQATYSRFKNRSRINVGIGKRLFCCPCSKGAQKKKHSSSTVVTDSLPLPIGSQINTISGNVPHHAWTIPQHLKTRTPHSRRKGLAETGGQSSIRRMMPFSLMAERGVDNPTTSAF